MVDASILDANLSGCEKLVYITLSALEQTNQNPTSDLIAQKASLSPYQVTTSLKILQKQGFIEGSELV